MAKIDVTKTELVWPGKYGEDGARRETPRVNLPFQVIETVNESRAGREARKGGSQQSLFDVYEGKEGDTFEEGWRNKLIWGDNLLVMGSLLEKFAGKIDLIYIDPPFATGADFSFTTAIGDSSMKVQKEQSIIEDKAYRDTWGHGTSSYVTMLYDRLRVGHNLLSPQGDYIWNVQYKPHRREYIERFKKDENGRLYRDDVNPTGGGSRTIYLDEVPGDIVDSVWDDIPPVNPVGSEKMDFPTQKPETLLSRILQASSREGSLVADFFCGSGTTLAVAEKLGRRWIGCDLGRWGVHVTRKRLLGIENCKPFEVLNLGKYERQYWQGATFGERGGQPITERALYEYLAFVLKLYGAGPLPGMVHLHGKKGAAMVHVGAVDAPVTIGEIEAAVDECCALKQRELHVLGWEWEMGLAGPNNDVRRGGLMHQVAKTKGVKLLLLQIPRELMEQQAADRGDVRFFELAYLEAEVEKPEKRTAQVALKDFVIPNPELVPDDVRGKIRKWSDWIDYWAVDWDFHNDTFLQGWVAYRTRKDRTLPLTSDPHAYERPGRYRVLVKVIDVFGNDTSQVFDVEV